MNFKEVFKGRRILLTGHTGFKGAWLASWLLELGAQVTGISLEPATEPHLFGVLGLQERLDHHICDIRDYARLAEIFQKTQPEVVLHLAAQPLVRLSYSQPRETFETNVGGTVNVLEAVRFTPSVRSCVIITTDKCYENREQIWGYRETDPMGGHDPYSASKGAAEIAVSSYRRSFFSKEGTACVASARAGNVIGGGDWALDRLVVDFIRSIVKDQPLVLRNPNSLRPWQHVLEPLGGYLLLAAKMLESDGRRYGDGWNFGPEHHSCVSVQTLAQKLVDAMGRGSVQVEQNSSQPHEAGLLELDIHKAEYQLGWKPVWNIDQTVQKTVEWYKAFYEGGEVRSLLNKQIRQYENDRQSSKNTK